MEASPCTLFKNVYSTILLIFASVIVTGLIFTRQTGLSQDAHPAVAFIVMWVAIIWLSMVEGSQASFVGLAPVDRELYKETHPICYKNSVLCHTGDNLDRYLMGRQFMVIFIVFTINLCGAPVADATLWGMPKIIIDIFLVTGFAMILFTCMIGQLNSQVNASVCMLDYSNNYFAYFTLCFAMAVEFSGLMHFSYIIQYAIGAMAGKPIESNEPPKSAAQAAFFYLRALISAAVLGFCMAVIFEALFKGQTTMWEGVPSWLSVILFVILLSVIGMLEGMQIAFFDGAKKHESERGDGYWAKKTCALLYDEAGYNLPGFMIGRQLCVVSCFFVVAGVTTIAVPEDADNLFGVSDSFQEFLNLGFCGAVVTTILGSITWQLVASAFPVAILSTPITYVLLVICLTLEATGICSGAWVLAGIHKKIANFQLDEVYIGTPEERRARANGDVEKGAIQDTERVAAIEEDVDVEA